VHYRVQYSPDAEEHLVALTARERRIALDAVDAQLSNEPVKPTRNRKLMRPNSIAPWELRIGKIRVYYEIDRLDRRLVNVLAIGIKERNKVRIGKEVVEL
jgi:mRNA-degrading endonuclease RelE of RelBE toxin-antitoxin system